MPDYYDNYTGYTIDYAEEARNQLYGGYTDPRSHEEIREEIRADWNRRANDPSEIERTKSRFYGEIEAYRKLWKSNDTPPEDRDRLFYAYRLEGFYETMQRIAEKSPCVPKEEYVKISEHLMRYRELIAILNGKTPQDFWRPYSFEPQTPWRFWPRFNKLGGDVLDA